MSGCPFGSKIVSRSNGPAPSLPTGKARVRLLYEEYVHLPSLRVVWETPVTDNPVLEPCFAAGMHGIELCFLLLAEFFSDERSYVAQRPRIERVADDIAAQCKLLVDILDGELEEEGTETNRLSLTQNFPFPGAPPCRDRPSFSPGLHHLEGAVQAALLEGMSQADRNAVVKLIINITSAFGISFQRWSVGLGVEPQLNSLRKIVGLSPLPFAHRWWLDYSALVHPEVVEHTLTCETYVLHEDFFFRTVHLSTECWAKVALARLRTAEEHAAMGRWHVAAARMGQASRILDYLGSHLLLLTTMNLRDYLRLKVELEGTSGEGSAQAKSFRPKIKALLEPLKTALLAADTRAKSSAGGDAEDVDAALRRALERVYEFPDAPNSTNRELYNYAKALEDVEAGLLGGFYFKHYLLASQMIGSDARGTMRRAVQALKSTYETQVFPILDRVRTGLGSKADAELAHVKGRMMDGIIARVTSGNSRELEVNPTASKISAETAPCCPFGGASNNAELEAVGPSKSAAALREPTALTKLYSWSDVPQSARSSVFAAMQRFSFLLGLSPHPESPQGAPLAFLDHAWGHPPPAALHAAMVDIEALYLLGNPSWDHLFGSIMPSASRHVLNLLGIPEKAAVEVHWGHNSHELVCRLLSELLVSKKKTGAQPLRVLTTDVEFFSFARQLNRLIELDAVQVEIVPSDPLASFPGRFAAAAAAAERPFDVAYVSQISFLKQQTLIPDVPALVKAVQSCAPLLIIDGYHSFCALPMQLGLAAEACCFLGGLIKHAGSGANAAFVTVPHQMSLRPAFTGWMADPSVLSASEPVEIGSSVNFDPKLALQGGTPAFFLPLVTFNHAMRLWSSCGVTLEAVHAHAVALQEEFLTGLPASRAEPEENAGPKGITRATLVNAGAAGSCLRSHTLVFEQGRREEAEAVVAAARKAGVLVDSRQRCVRVGFGPNHTLADVKKLLLAVQ